MPTLAIRTKAGLDFELAFDRGDDDVGLELGVSLQVGKRRAAIGTGANADRDHLVDVFGFGPVGRGMVVGPAWGFGRAVLELVIFFAERMRGAVLVPLLLGALLLEEVAFGSKLLNLKLEIGDFFLKQGTLRTGSNGHGNSSAQGQG